MLPICVRPERVWPKLSSIQGIRANLVYIVSLRQKWNILWQKLTFIELSITFLPQEKELLESSIQRLIHEKNKIDSSNQSSEELTAQILQNIDFKQAEDLLKANQIQQLKSDESSEPMVVVDLNENIKKDILFHAKFLLKVSIKLHYH